MTDVGAEFFNQPKEKPRQRRVKKEVVEDNQSGLPSISGASRHDATSSAPDGQSQLSSNRNGSGGNNIMQKALASRKQRASAGEEDAVKFEDHSRRQDSFSQISGGPSRQPFSGQHTSRDDQQS